MFRKDVRIFQNSGQRKGITEGLYHVKKSEGYIPASGELYKPLAILVMATA